MSPQPRPVRSHLSPGGSSRIGLQRGVLALGVLFLFLFAAAGAASANGLGEAISVQERHTDRLLEKPGVVGTAVGRTAVGRPAVKVFTTKGGAASVPAKLNGVPVRVRVTGKLSAAHHRPGHSGGPGGGGGGDDDGTSALKPTDIWPRPVPIGISTGNEGACSAGTIGARVSSGGSLYALSNNHVYARENQAPIGSRVLQPGLFDTGCQFSESNVLGTLSDYQPIVFSRTADNTMDAAIAQTSGAALGSATPGDGYGAPSSAHVEGRPGVGIGVQKYGRTTALTKGTVASVNATVQVGFGSGTARFVDQVIVESRKPFTKSGDSGSLIVRDPQRNPVGLLFASDSSGKFTVANRIDLVLDRFGATVDGD